LEATLLLPHFDQDIYMGFQIYGFITAEASYITYRLLPITYYVYIIDYTNLICSLQILINLKMLLNVTNSDRILDCLCFSGARKLKHICKRWGSESSHDNAK
jgi:hypothetical protein